jgi:hypothetical protein
MAITPNPIRMFMPSEPVSWAASAVSLSASSRVSLPSSTSLEMSSVIFVAHPDAGSPMARRYHELRHHVRFWHKADMLNALTNVAFGGKADSDQPLLTNLDL